MLCGAKDFAWAENLCVQILFRFIMMDNLDDRRFCCFNNKIYAWLFSCETE